MSAHTLGVSFRGYGFALVQKRLTLSASVPILQALQRTLCDAIPHRFLLEREMDASQMNTALVLGQGALRAEIEAWARAQSSSLNAACARAEFEAAVLEAVRDGIEWQEHTNSDLCSALGHCTLAYRVKHGGFY